MSTLDAKVSKATLSYNKYATKTSNTPHGTAQLDSLTASHSAYIQTLHSLQSQANLLQVSYGEQIALKRECVGREVARSVTGLAEKSWRNRVEGTRRGGECVGKVLAKGVWVSDGMENVGENERRGLELRGGRYEEEKEEEGTTPQPQSQSQSQKENTSPKLESNKTLRGPRAPSTSTTDARLSSDRFATSSNSSKSHELPPTPRPLSSQDTPQSQPTPYSSRIDSPKVAARVPSPQASRHQSVEEQAQSNSNEIGGGRTLPRGWYLDPSFANHHDENETVQARTSMETQDHFDETPQEGFARSSQEDLTPRPAPAERRQTYDTLSDRREGEDGILRKPTPRYGSAPASNQVPGSFPEHQADEFGRTGRGDEQREGEGRESFVRRMSQKYGAVAEPSRDSREVSRFTGRLAVHHAEVSVNRPFTECSSSPSISRSIEFSSLPSRETLFFTSRRFLPHCLSHSSKRKDLLTSNHQFSSTFTADPSFLNLSPIQPPFSSPIFHFPPLFFLLPSFPRPLTTLLLLLLSSTPNRSHFNLLLLDV